MSASPASIRAIAASVSASAVVSPARIAAAVARAVRVTTPLRHPGRVPGSNAPQKLPLVRLRHLGCRNESGMTGRGGAHRSEEHTSELQSLMRNSYAVFGLT